MMVIMLQLKWTTSRNSDRVLLCLLLWHKQQSLRRRREILTLEENPGMMSLASLSCFSSRESLSFTLPSFFSAKKMESRLYYCFLRLLLLILLLKSCAEPDESLLKAVEETRLSSIVVIETREEAVAKNREVRILSVEKELDVTDCSLFFLQFPSS